MCAIPSEYYECQYHSSALFRCLFKPYDHQLIEYLERWITNASATEMTIIGRLLREANGAFVFEQKEFVSRYLTAALDHGHEVYEHALSSLSVAATSGIRSRTRGEASEKDLTLKSRSEEAISTLPRTAPEYRLYAEILKHAKHEIQYASIEREALEDEDD